MDSAQSQSLQPQPPSTDPKTPRVLVDGPGGAEVKQGARIACDNCRQAKIKCSAPTDGQVPCSRCLKAQKPCLFYKHQRGRKPGRLNNRTKKDAAAAVAAGGHAEPSSDNEYDDDDDDDDSMPLASTSAAVPPASSKPSSSSAPAAPAAPATKSAKGASRSAVARTSPSKARQLNMSSLGTGPVPASHLQGGKNHAVPAQGLPPPGTSGQKRKRNSTDFRHAGNQPDSNSGSSPAYKYALLARAPSPAPSRTSTVGSQSAAIHHGKRSGSIPAAIPPALLERTSLSGSGSGSGSATNSRTNSRRGSASPPPMNPASPAAKGYHNSHTSGRHASPEEAAIAANSLMWYSSATKDNSGTPADRKVHTSEPRYHPNAAAQTHAPDVSGMYAYAGQHQQQQQQQQTSSAVPDVSALTNAGLLDPNSIVNAYSHLDYDRQRLLTPLYQAAQQQLDPSSMAGLNQGQTPQVMDWQKRLQEQMQQASYDSNQIAAAAAAVQQISNVLMQQTQQHQQAAMQQLLSKSSIMTQQQQPHGRNLSGPSGSGSSSSAGPTATHGPGHITIPTHPPPPPLSHASGAQPRSATGISPTTPLGAPGTPTAASSTYTTNARNGPMSAPLSGMSGYPAPFNFSFAAAPPAGVGPMPVGGNDGTASRAGVSGMNPPPVQQQQQQQIQQTQQQVPAPQQQQPQQGMMAPPPPRHSNSFQGFDSGHARLHNAGPGAALHVGTSGAGRSGSFSEAMHSAGRAYGSHPPALQVSGNGAGAGASGLVHRSQSFSQAYDAGFAAGYGAWPISYDPAQQTQQQQLHMSGGKAHPGGGSSQAPHAGAIGAGHGAAGGGGAGTMPPYVRGARGSAANARASALKADHTMSAVTSPGTGTGAGAGAGTGAGTSSAGADAGGPLSRLRSLSNGSGSGSGGEPAFKRARVGGDAAAMGSQRPIDEEGENGDDVDMGQGEDGMEGVEGDDEEAEEEDEEDDDDDDDDDDAVSEEEDDHVLSNPLRLLAQASGAAAAMDQSGPQYQQAAETMGLLCVRRGEDNNEGMPPPAEPRDARRPPPVGLIGTKRKDAPLDFYRSSRPPSASPAPPLGRPLTSPRNRPADLGPLPSLVRNPPTSTAAGAAGGLTVAAAPGGPLSKTMYRPPRPVPDDLHWMLGPRRLTSGVAALVGHPRHFMRPTGLPIPDAPPYRSGLPPLSSSASDSALHSDPAPPAVAPLSARASSFHSNGMAAGAAARRDGSTSGSVHDDDGASGLGDGDDGRTRFPRQRRTGRGFESSSARSTGGIDDDDDVVAERDANAAFPLRRSFMSDTRRTSMGAVLGMSPHSPVQHSLSQPTPVRVSDLFRAGDAGAGGEEHRQTFSQPEPLRKDARHGAVTAESLKELDRVNAEAEREQAIASLKAEKEAAGKAKLPSSDAVVGAQKESVPATEPTSVKQDDKMDVDDVEESSKVAAAAPLGPSLATGLARAKESSPGKEVGNVSVQSETARPPSALGKTSPDVSMDAPSVRTPDRSALPPHLGAVASGSADKSMENPSPSPAMSPPVLRRRRLSLSIDTPKDGIATGVFPSPSQHNDWEYKDGRARAKGASVSNGSGVPFQGLHLLPGLGVRGGKAHTVAGGLTPAMKPTPDPNVPPASPAPEGELLPPPLLPRAVVPRKKQPKSLVSFSGLESLPHDLTMHRRGKFFNSSFHLKEKKEKDRMKKKKSTAGMTDMSGRSKLTNRTRFQDDGKDDTLPNMGDDESEDDIDFTKPSYFNVSLWTQRLDVDSDSEDPVDKQYIDLKDVERLFDVFFNHINPLLLVFDPFLHSVNRVRRRSAFLTTVIISLAARFVDTQRDAALAVSLEHLWLEKQLPRILSGGFKSVEIAQAFVILAMFHKPTHSLADDRSWQYLGFAIRMATEIGVNRRITPSESVRSKEQVRRRVRNRERLWCNLFLCDRIMSAQTGRPWTISDDLLSPEVSRDWHMQDFALPSDAVVVSMIRLRRTVARHTKELDAFLSKEHSSLARNSQALSYLDFLRHTAENDLERWRDSWSDTTNGENHASPEWGPFSTHWQPISKLYCQHSLLHINSFALQAIEKFDQLPSTVYKDCWTSALEVVKITLELGQDKLMYAPNHLIVMSVYAAVSALRLLNKDKHKNPWVDRDAAISAVRDLITALNEAGKTPQHRNGAAVPYAKYLTSVLALWDPPAARSAIQEPKKSKDPPRATSPNRLRSVSDAAAFRMRPRDREVAMVSNNAIIMPGSADPRERKPERNSLGSKPGPSSIVLGNSLLPTNSPAHPSTSTAAAGPSSFAVPSLPIPTENASSTPMQPQLHPHPIDRDSLGAWAGGIVPFLPTTPTGDAYGLQRSASSAPITALSTPAIGADTSGDVSTTPGVDTSRMGQGMDSTALGASFLSMSMAGIGGLNVTGVNLPTDGSAFLMTGPAAPSTSSTAAAAPGSAGPTMMRAPHQHRHVSGGQWGTAAFMNINAPGGVASGVGNPQLREAFLDDANWTFPAAETEAVVPPEGATVDDGNQDRMWDYLTSWDGSVTGNTSGFWQPQQAAWNFSSY